MSAFSEAVPGDAAGGGMFNVFWQTIRFLMWPLIRLIYRDRIVGAENFPRTGGVLFVPNHISYADAVILGVMMKRPLRFVISRQYYEMPVVGWLARLFRPVPVASNDSPGAMRRSIQVVIDSLKAGDVVCMFAEGCMSRTGQVQPFQRGLELIARRAGVPIIPAYLDGLWGSLFSYWGGRYILKWPPSFSRRVILAIGKPLPPSTPHWNVRQAVLGASVEAFAARKRHQIPLHMHFWRIARRRWWGHCMADSTGRSLTWGRTLVASLALARWMERKRPGEKMVGMMMPASVGAALVNVGALVAGRVPVNLNFTGARHAIQSAIDTCKLKTVFTSRALLEKTGLPERPEYLYMEDVLSSMSKKEMFVAFLLGALLPACLARRFLMRPVKMDDLATVMFTSGSTGEPKGVMLSHHNVVSNIEGFSEVLRFRTNDTMAGVLPLFHSFGFTATLWAPLTRGMRVAYHPNPLDAKGVGQLIEKHRATIIAGTSSFFAMYARGCKPEQFASLRLAVAGGQKLVPEVATAFKERFGLALSEGYGCTELSPVVAVNSDDVRHGRIVQHSSREGSVGRPLPGLLAQAVGIESGEPLGADESGIVLIRGASVMQAYMDNPEATAAVIRDGWYVTNDVGRIDEDGYLFIEDRISRFSKIGGEMVPHSAVEEALRTAAEDTERRFAVVTLPDRVRGEKLAVAYTGEELDVNALLKRLGENGIPNLWLPAPSDFHRVEDIPLLPTGKPDLVSVRKMIQG
jgi:acyl-[acyl-carrier-protein]-phospholipid O-acyltransferase/long-chain-fatty-acid--[acyl-carrier-protein] ligase